MSENARQETKCRVFCCCKQCGTRWPEDTPSIGGRCAKCGAVYCAKFRDWLVEEEDGAWEKWWDEQWSMTALQAQLAEARKEIERLQPRTIEQAEALVLELATRFRAFGAMICQCRQAWAKLLEAEYGIKDGAWDVRRDLALAKAQEENERLRAVVNKIAARLPSLERDSLEGDKVLCHAQMISSLITRSQTMDRMAAVYHQAGSEDRS